MLITASIMTKALGWDNFDAVAFQHHFNEGFPMTIKDTADAFYVLDDWKLTHGGDGQDKVATIKCDPVPQERNHDPLVSDAAKFCENPDFSIKRYV